MTASDMRGRTVAELVAAGTVAEADLDKSVQAYLDDHTIPKVHLGQGCVVDPGRAVEADATARDLVARHDAAPDALRRAVRAAILAARSVA